MGFYSGNHRTICAVLEEMRTLAENTNLYDEFGVLIDEAKSYAERMSAKLTKYKTSNSPNPPKPDPPVPSA